MSRLYLLVYFCSRPATSARLVGVSNVQSPTRLPRAAPNGRTGWDPHALFSVSGPCSDGTHQTSTVGSLAPAVLEGFELAVESFPNLKYCFLLSSPPGFVRLPNWKRFTPPRLGFPPPFRASTSPAAPRRRLSLPHCSPSQSSVSPRPSHPEPRGAPPPPPAFVDRSFPVYVPTASISSPDHRRPRRSGTCLASVAGLGDQLFCVVLRLCSH